MNDLMMKTAVAIKIDQAIDNIKTTKEYEEDCGVEQGKQEPDKTGRNNTQDQHLEGSVKSN